MKIGKYSERITLQVPVVRTDKYARHTNGWEDLFTCFSHVMTYEVSEVGDEVVRFTDTVVFECRHCPELEDLQSNTCRIVYRGLVYNVLSIDRMNYNRCTVRFKAQTKGEKADG